MRKFLLIYVILLLKGNLSAQPEFHYFSGQFPNTITDFIERLQYDQDSLFTLHNIRTKCINYEESYPYYYNRVRTRTAKKTSYEWYDINQINIGHIKITDNKLDSVHAWIKLNYINPSKIIGIDSTIYFTYGKPVHRKNFYIKGKIDSTWSFHDLSFNRGELFKKKKVWFEEFTSKYHPDTSFENKVQVNSTNRFHFKKKYRRFFKDTFLIQVIKNEQASTLITQYKNYSKSKDSFVFEKPTPEGSYKNQWFYSPNLIGKYYEDSFYENRITFSRQLDFRNYYKRSQLFADIKNNYGDKIYYFYDTLNKIERVEKVSPNTKEYIFFIYDYIGLLKEAIYVPPSSAPIVFKYTYYANDYWIYDKDYKIINPYELRYN